MALAGENDESNRRGYNDVAIGEMTRMRGQTINLKAFGDYEVTG